MKFGIIVDRVTISYFSFKVTDQSGRCGAFIEDVRDFLVDCPLHADQIRVLIDKLNWLPEMCPLSIELLIRDKHAPSDEENVCF